MNNYIKTNDNQQVLELQLNVLIFEQGDFYVALCPSLNLSSYGDSVQDAKEGFDEAMRIYIAECQKNGSLHEDLVKIGWRLENNKKAEPPSQVEINIPAGLLKTQFNENWKVAMC